MYVVPGSQSVVVDVQSVVRFRRCQQQLAELSLSVRCICKHPLITALSWPNASSSKACPDYLELGAQRKMLVISTGRLVW